MKKDKIKKKEEKFLKQLKMNLQLIKLRTIMKNQLEIWKEIIIDKKLKTNKNKNKTVKINRKGMNNK